MTAAKRFEDLEVWGKARDVVNAIYQASSVGTFCRDYALPHGIYDSGVIPRGERDQIRRAAVSIPSNVVHPVK
ncbi:four helix bundle protein [Candidatus Bipolaricaulota bacterium]|nr:four helix bundle protein [Candidatus Bipolaricaulota bacterium]